jgi:superfamily I DNA and RNA helicase
MNESTTTTTIRVSKKTVKTLEDMREKFNAQTLDETIQLLVKKQRKAALDKGFGVAQNRIKPYTEADRGEDRS